jgi:hypothetical protein
MGQRAALMKVALKVEAAIPNPKDRNAERKG